MQVSSIIIDHSIIIIFQCDMSLAFVTFAVFVSMWWVAVGRMVDLTIYLAAVGGSIAIAFGSITELQNRFAAWVDPWSNAEFGAAITRSSFALAGGGLTGTGPGGGSADWVPAATDQFAFVPIAEELGFIGGVAIVSSYLLLVGIGLVRGYAVGVRDDTTWKGRSHFLCIQPLA